MVGSLGRTSGPGKVFATGITKKHPLCWERYLSAVWDSRGRNWYIRSTCCGIEMHLHYYLLVVNSFGSLAKLFPKWLQ